MFKSLIAGVTAVSLTFARAMPAQANGFDREDAGKLIIGLAAIAALNAALENRNRNDRQPEQVQDRRQRHPQGWNGHPRRQDNRKVLPSACVREIQTPYGDHRMFMRRCLERNAIRVSQLPDRCEVRLFTNDGPRNGFDPACMRQEGYRSDRRR